MKSFIIFIILKVCLIICNDISESEYYDPEEDNGAYLITVLFNKLNTILSENSNMKKDLFWINKRLQNQTQSLDNVTHVLKKVTKRQEQQLNLTKQFTAKVESMDKTINSLYINAKSLNQNHGWIAIQRRQDGSENFYRNWMDYKSGFGEFNNEFFIGLESLHNITTYGATQELMIIMKDFENQTRYAKYDKFVIGSEFEKYVIKDLGRYSGDAGDSFKQHKGAKFSTFDQDNDRDEFGDCANEFKGAWWFHNCYDSHLNGPYLPKLPTSEGGINWRHWHGDKYSLKFVEMMIRART